MMHPTIAVTITNCVQRGVDTYVDKRITKVFDDTASFADLFSWARSEGMADVHLSDFVLSEVAR